MALPTPINLSEFRHSGGFIVSEAHGTLSRDTITYVNTGSVDVQVVAGTVLALSSEGSDAVVTPAGAGTNGANTGTGTITAPTFGAQAKPGVYKITFTGATTFTVTDPTGDVLTTTGATGTAFLDAQLGFTITAGGTAFVAGDGFAITVPPLLSRFQDVAETVITPKSGNTGNGAITALSFGNTFRTGTYTVALTSATAFTVTDPGNTVVGAGTVGTAFSATELGFLLSAGTAAFVSGDAFYIVVPAGANHMQNWVNAAPAVAIAYNTEWVRAGQFKEITAITRLAEVTLSELIWDPSITSAANPQALYATATAQLANVGILAR